MVLPVTQFVVTVLILLVVMQATDVTLDVPGITHVEEPDSTSNM